VEPLAGEAWEAAGTLRRALQLWRRPTLADVAHARFAQPEIARLEDLRLACVSDRIDADLACGRHAKVAGELEALVREHPLRERLRGQQMLALYGAGRQAEALEAYRSAYEALVDGSASSRRRTYASSSRRSCGTRFPPSARRRRAGRCRPTRAGW
jgi:DNA-binding SARP family transcriptional activator